MFKPRHLTSEPAEHRFGMMRQIIREFTCLEFAQLDNIDDISEKVLAASSCLEGKVNMQGAASLDRKSKSLVQRESEGFAAR